MSTVRPSTPMVRTSLTRVFGGDVIEPMVVGADGLRMSEM